MSDAINPSHYQSPNGIELIDVINHLNYSRSNAIKYIFRAGRKNPDKELEDLQKAQWLINREIDKLIHEKQKSSSSTPHS
jgi:hypothetical protein